MKKVASEIGPGLGTSKQDAQRLLLRMRRVALRGVTMMMRVGMTTSSPSRRCFARALPSFM